MRLIVELDQRLEPSEVARVLQDIAVRVKLEDGHATANRVVRDLDDRIIGRWEIDDAA